MKNFTMVPNELFEPSQLSIRARYLHSVLIKYCGQKDHCFPSQETLAKVLGVSSRQVRNILNELIDSGLIKSIRKGFNRSNTYEVAKKFHYDDRKFSSPQLSNMFPFQPGNNVPTKDTYVNKKAKKSIKGFEMLRDTMIKRRLLTDSNKK